MKCVMQKYLSIYYLFDVNRVGSQNGSRNTNSLHTCNSDTTVTIDAPTSTVTWIRFGSLRLQLQCNVNRRALSLIITTESCRWNYLRNLDQFKSEINGQGVTYGCLRMYWLGKSHMHSNTCHLLTLYKKSLRTEFEFVEF